MAKANLKNAERNATPSLSSEGLIFCSTSALFLAESVTVGLSRCRCRADRPQRSGRPFEQRACLLLAFERMRMTGMRLNKPHEERGFVQFAKGGVMRSVKVPAWKPSTFRDMLSVELHARSLRFCFYSPTPAMHVLPFYLYTW